MPRPVLIDTDTGVDDALALILALRSPEFSVKAVTTVAGNVEVERCTRNVHFIVDLLNLPDRLTIAQGSKKPLRKHLVTAPEVHGADGLGNTMRKLQRHQKRGESGAAVKVILECCRRYGPRLTIIALGPLTNLARALKRNGRVFRRVGKIVSMGGAFRVPGNTGPVAEFNYFVDPDAAHMILNAGLPVTVVPLDLTEQIVMMRRELEYRARRRASKLARTILRFTSHYMQYHRRAEGFLGGYLHDPITVAVALEPSIAQGRQLHVDVECKGTITRGMSVAEFRERPKRGRKVIRVALRVDRERFLKLFHERLWQ